MNQGERRIRIRKTIKPGFYYVYVWSDKRKHFVWDGREHFITDLQANIPDWIDYLEPDYQEKDAVLE